MNDFINTFKASIYHTANHKQHTYNRQMSTVHNIKQTLNQNPVSCKFVPRFGRFFCSFFDTGDKMSMSQKLIFSSFVLNLFWRSFH